MNIPFTTLLRRSGAFLLLAGLSVAGFVAEVSAQGFSYCLQEDASDQRRGTRISRIYISGTEGRILEICVEIPGARLSVTGTGSLSLLERDADVEVEYFSGGAKAGLVREIDDIDIDYFSSGDRAGRVQVIENLDFDYFGGAHAGKIKEISNLQVEYFSSGPQAGKLREIDSVSFEYSSSGVLEADGGLRGIDLLIR